MIKNKSRARWFGASDTKFIVGNWNTKTFMLWWLTKLGLRNESFSNVYTLTGTHKEHQITRHYADKNNLIIELDKQRKNKKLKLRVNYDAETKEIPIEIKTRINNKENWKPPKHYINQLQVEIFGKGKKCKGGKIVVYALNEADYQNFFLPIDNERLTEYYFERDNNFLENEYLPRLKYLAHCLKKRKTPNELEFLDKKYKHKLEIKWL